MGARSVHCGFMAVVNFNKDVAVAGIENAVPAAENSQFEIEKARRKHGWVAVIVKEMTQTLRRRAPTHSCSLILEGNRHGPNGAAFTDTRKVTSVSSSGLTEDENR